MKRIATLIAAATMGGLSGRGMAAAPAPDVDVQLGPAVQSRMADLGQDELTAQARYLRRDVLSALAHSPNPPQAVHLVIADIEPNRPTSAQLGASPQLQMSSFGFGGAAITGEVVTADGRRLPVRYRFFQTQRQAEVNFTTWGDADQAFDDLADAIGAGRTPDDPGQWPPPHTARAVTGTRIPG